MSTQPLIANRYQLTDPIGVGAMGDVYRASDTQTGAIVAVKHLKPDLVARAPDMLARFKREGEALRELNHPNIVTLLEVAEEDGNHYLVMEYVPGGDLHGLIADNPGGLPVERALAIALDLADALTRAHRLEILHRDIKPANVLLAEDGTPRLTDFGIARVGSGSDITASGVVMGTYAYLSPEACMGETLDERADIWAFGVMLYEMLAGQRPFAGDSPGAMMMATLQTPLPDIGELRVGISDDLNDLLYRMLAKNREERIPSVRLVGVEIEAMMKGVSVTSFHAAQRTTSVFDTPTPDESRQHLNLPSHATPFVGRHGALKELEALVDGSPCRLVTLLGPGGMGKTRLGIEAARRQSGSYAHGVHFVPLAPLKVAEHMPSVLATALDFNFSGGGTPEEQLLAYLHEKNLLLVMDNFEHLVSGAGLVSEILDAAPGVRVIATSRSRLNLGAECVYEVGGLDVPQDEGQMVFEEIEAVEMFITYARRAQPGFELDEAQKASVVRICQLVGGMPLGLELAAGWARMLAPEEIAAELEADIDFLESEREDLPQRQRSMRAVFDYSWNMLSKAEQDALMKFSVFRGGASRRAAQKVSGASLRTLTGLADKSLIHRDPQSGDLSIHELLRQFAEERLEDSGMSTETRTAHSQYYLGALAGYLPDVKGRAQKRAFADIEEDFENVRAAWLWALETRMTSALRGAADTLMLFTYLRARLNDLEMLFDAVIAAYKPEPGQQTDPFYGIALSRRWGHLQLFPHSREMVRVNRDLDESYRVAVEADDAFEIAFVLLMKGYALYQFDEDYPAALATYEDVLARFQALGDPYYIAWGLHRVGYMYTFLGQSDESVAYTEKSLVIARQIGDGLTATNCLFNNGSSFLVKGDYARARDYFQEAVDLVTAISSNLWQAVHASALLSIALVCLGDFQAARRVADVALEIDKNIAYRSAYLRIPFIMLACYGEDYDEGQRIVTEARQFGNNPLGEIFLNATEALNACGQGDFERVAAIITLPAEIRMQLLEIDDTLTLEGGTIIFMIPTTLMLAHLGSYEAAVELLGLVLGHPNAPVSYCRELPLLVDLAERLKSELGSQAYDAAIEKGPNLSGVDIVRIMEREGLA